MTDKTQTKAVSNAPLQMRNLPKSITEATKIIDFVGH